MSQRILWICNGQKADCKKTAYAYTGAQTRKPTDFPTIEPERIRGRWNRISPARIYECSVCGQNVMTNDIAAYKYCHGCGAEMEQADE